jgi:DNA-binding MarR family transcriptional regulator
VTPAPTRPRHSEQAENDIGIVDALAQLSFLIQGTLAKHVANRSSSVAQIRLLGVLRDREPTMQELARLLELDKSSVTGLVDRAEQRLLVERKPSSEDRRAIHVRLTPSGRRTVADVASAFQADVASLTACLSETETRRLSTLATRIVHEYAAAQGIDPAKPN